MLPHLIDRVTPRHTGTVGRYDITLTRTPVGEGLAALAEALAAGTAA